MKDLEGLPLQPVERRHRLYDLLPALYRLRDTAPGGGRGPKPLQVLLGVLEEQLERLEGDVLGLYDNWFIETCQEWVVPYIGDLLRVRALDPATAQVANRRGFVARTIEYRQRKGTASVLERLAYDVTGWPTRGVESFRLLATTQNLNHLRLGNLAYASLRDANRLELLGSAFEDTTHAVDVRRIESGRGRYNLPHVALFAWRLRAFRIDRARPSWRAELGGPILFRFDSWARDAALFGPRVSRMLDATIGELDVPAPLRPRALHEAIRSGATKLPFEIEVAGVPLAANEIQICDLSSTTAPPAAGYAASVDPRSGRFVLRPEVAPESVRVTYHYGFSADLGGGAYDRGERLGELPELTVRHTVSRGGVELAAALAAFEAAHDEVTLIEITDNEEHALTTPLRVGAGRRLVLRAANGCRPVIDASSLPAEIELGRGAGLELSGLCWVCSELLLRLDGGPAGCSVSDSSWAPRRLQGETRPAPFRARAQGDASDIASASLALRLDRVITGPIQIEREHAGGVLACELELSDSIVDAGGSALAALSADRAELVRCTIFGPVSAASLSADNTLFSDLVAVERVQDGCLRYSYVPLGSRTARRYRCQPETALNAARAGGTPARLRPIFASTRFGDADYAELDPRSAPELLRGADDESEMGVFQRLHRPQCASNLHTSLEEYLRFGLEAGLVIVNQGSQP